MHARICPRCNCKVDVVYQKKPPLEPHYAVFCPNYAKHKTDGWGIGETVEDALTDFHGKFSSQLQLA